MAHEGYHELDGDLRPETKDLHRAIVSLQEELEAADWYQQCVDATNDDELSAILAHNRDEEKEHAAMLLEWLRRHDPTFDQQLRTYLFHRRRSPRSCGKPLRSSVADAACARRSGDRAVGQPAGDWGSLERGRRM